MTVVDQKFAHNLGLRGEKIKMSVRGLWGGEKHEKCEKISFIVEGPFGKQMVGHALSVPNVASPTQTVSSKITRQIKDRMCMDIEPYQNAKALILIGQDNWGLIHSFESQTVEGTGLVVSRTLLGWVLHGYCENGSCEIRTFNVQTTICAADCDHGEVQRQLDGLDNLIRQFFILENFGPSDANGKIKENTDRATKILHGTTRKIGNAWETGLLWSDDILPDSDTRVTALKRLRSIEKRQDRDPDFAEKYHKEMERLISNGYAVKVDKNVHPSRVRYIPHFGVTNPNKPGKVRLVFDAAAKTDKISMNDLLDTGPDLLESLVGVLLRFRQYPYAVKADIKDMYLRVKVIEQDQSAQRFSYRGADRSREPDEYKMTSLIFGSKSSPCSAIFVKNLNAEQFAKEKPETAKSIVRNSYMDDYLSSGSDIKQMQQLVRNVVLINRDANFEMHGWASNEPQIIEVVQEENKLEKTEKASLGNEEERVLGLYWDRDTDTLRFDIGLQKITENLASAAGVPTKREVTSIAMSVYDPLGILSPFILNVKFLIQDIWVSGVGWDAKIGEDEFEKWRTWLRNLQQMGGCHIPRSFIPENTTYSNTQLHIFCDASKYAFAAVAYLRITGADGIVHTALVMAKTRVAPMKPTTTPRLELQAALLGARLADKIGQELDIKIDERIFWSDATIVLHWIKTGPRTKQVFVANRLAEINQITRSIEWHWVPSDVNPADKATRHSNKLMTSEDEWFTGPKFLKETPCLWPRSKELNDAERREAENTESRKEFVSVSFLNPSELCEVSARIRILGWNRLVKTAEKVRKYFDIWYRKIPEKRNASFVQAVADGMGEAQIGKSTAAEEFWYRAIQAEHFSNDIDAINRSRDLPKGSKLIGLQPYIDNKGILRAKGRVTKIFDSQAGKSKGEVLEFENRPIILDANHYATKLLIQLYHKKYYHANNETVVNELRQKFYIIGLRVRLRWMAKRCITCLMSRAEPQNPPMADLPKCRVAYGQWPFSHCGIDYFGPMFVKIGRRRDKRWGVLFTCMTTRAVHLELAHTLSASSTIMAVQRLAARRGLPLKMFSDNGTNFVKARKELHDAITGIDTDKQRQFAELHRFTWQFNPPDAPHMGGAWERLIRSVKIGIDHSLNGESCSEEVLLTLLAEVEHTVNSRPLTHVSTDPNNEKALTPNHILMGRSSGNLRIPRYENEIANQRKTFEAVQSLANGFWKRWLREYLPTLLPRNKWNKPTTPLQINDIVLILDYQTPRNGWRKGTVVEVYQNKSDGVIRSAKVRSGKSTFVRPVHKLIKIFGAEEFE